MVSRYSLIHRTYFKVSQKFYLYTDQYIIHLSQFMLPKNTKSKVLEKMQLNSSGSFLAEARFHSDRIEAKLFYASVLIVFILI